VTDEAPDLRTRHDWKAIIGTVAAAGAIAWAVVKWAATTPTRDEFEHVRNDVFNIRLDQETVKGEVKAINVRVEEGFRGVNTKLDSTIDSRQKRR